MKNDSLPNLGRPFVADSPRKNYIRFRLSDLENDDFLRREEFVKSFYSDRGISYNRSDFLRALLKFVDDVDILDSIIVTDKKTVG
ncbi:hypothetical protein E0765_07005 [Sulfuricurvum sp. IAE1]|uniref:hypothetical protein n=1 Tax=Sulfuricurvum sp. IAE1 TaxID=2546102 RepID=UPI0010535921|nr:hypothetical protein [Sulfuricurvum sp. IAE1]TDA63576.1 hypothetical protein E0765_07005 [Sulfuricurvum sp. IAE1]